MPDAASSARGTISAADSTPPAPSPTARFNLDPQIGIFAETIMSGAPATGSAPPTLSEIRDRAAAARAPWNAGGPVMRDVLDRVVSIGGRETPVRIFRAAPGPLVAIFYLHGGGWSL